ncbi:MAG: rRNA maturation RNase YbeY [Parcubacteria group bacterium]|nr:rRNA maturation RNase YbeY [Parcubacteria group bacterium]
MKNEILVYNKTKRRVPEKLIKLIISGALKFLKLKQPVEMAVLVLSGVEIKRLNKVWRGKNNIPDELSFGLNSRQTVKFAKDNNGMLELGEIAVNVDKIYDRKRLSKILVHALLHLLGHHHEKSAAQAKKMEQLEKKILSNL